MAAATWSRWVLLLLLLLLLLLSSAAVSVLCAAVVAKAPLVARKLEKGPLQGGGEWWRRGWGGWGGGGGGVGVGGGGGRGRGWQGQAYSLDAVHAKLLRISAAKYPIKRSLICPALPEIQDAVTTIIACRVSAVQRVACCGMLSFNCAGNTSKNVFCCCVLLPVG